MLAGGSTAFPAFVVAAPQTATTSFATAVSINPAQYGQSFNFWDNSRWVNLSNAPDLNLDGLAQFNARFFYTPSSTGSGAQNMLLSSVGAKCRTDSLSGNWDSALWIRDDNSTVVGKLNVGGTVYTLAGGTLVANTMHHVALSYDGSTISLYLDGSRVASAAASGTVTQKRWESVVVGPYFAHSRETCLLANGPRGKIQGIQISNVARNNGASLTVPSVHTPDTNSLITVNLDRGSDDLIIGYDTHGGGFGYMPMHYAGAPVAQNRVQIDGLRLTDFNQGIYCYGTTDTLFRDLYMTGVKTDGLLLRNNSYSARIQDVHVVGTGGANGARGAGIALQEASGASGIQDFKIQGFTYPLFVHNSGATIERGYISAAANQTAWGMYATGMGGSLADLQASGVRITDEGGGAFQSVAHLDSLRVAKLSGCVLETYSNNVPQLTADEGDTATGFPVKVDGCDFRGGDPGSAGHVVPLGTWPGTNQIQVHSSRKTVGSAESTRPWSTSAVVGSLGC